MLKIFSGDKRRQQIRMSARCIKKAAPSSNQREAGARRKSHSLEFRRGDRLNGASVQHDQHADRLDIRPHRQHLGRDASLHNQFRYVRGDL